MKSIISSVIICLLSLAVATALILNPPSLFNAALSEQSIIVKNGAGEGKDAVVPVRPKRVVFLNSSSLDLWLGAGGKENVAACIRFQTAPKGLYEKLGEDTEIIGEDINVSIEKVLQQKPDLVITGGTGRAQITLLENLQSMGVPVLAINNESVADTYYELSLYGQMNGQPELAKREIERIRQGISAIKQSYVGKEKPKVALVWGTPASFSLMKPNSRQGELLKLAGGENIVQDMGLSSRYIPVSLEYIAKEDPDQIFFVIMGNKDKMQSAIDKLLSESSAWQLLRAVQKKQVHILPPKLFTSHYGLSVDESVRYMNRLLYPEES